MGIITVENFELVIDGLGELLIKSVDLPAYKTDISSGDTLMSGKTGAVRQTLSKKRESAVQITVKTLASGDATSTSSILRQWVLDCMPSSEDGGGFAADARKTGSINTYNTAGEVIDSWTLSGVWPCKYEIGQLSVEGGVLEETFTLQVDQFDPGT